MSLPPRAWPETRRARVLLLEGQAIVSVTASASTRRSNQMAHAEESRLLKYASRFHSHDEGSTCAKRRQHSVVTCVPQMQLGSRGSPSGPYFPNDEPGLIPRVAKEPVPGQKFGVRPPPRADYPSAPGLANMRFVPSTLTHATARNSRLIGLGVPIPRELCCDSTRT